MHAFIPTLSMPFSYLLFSRSPLLSRIPRRAACRMPVVFACDASQIPFPGGGEFLVVLFWVFLFFFFFFWGP